MRVTCPAHLIRRRLIIVPIIDEEHKLRTSSLCNIMFSSLQLLPSSLVRTLYSAPGSLTPAVYVLHLLRYTKIHIHTRVKDSKSTALCVLTFTIFDRKRQSI